MKQRINSNVKKQFKKFLPLDHNCILHNDKENTLFVKGFLR